VTCVQENAADILATAQDINAERAARQAVVEDTYVQETAEAPQTEEAN
jgi:hypothetical protein